MSWRGLLPLDPVLMGSVWYMGKTLEILDALKAHPGFNPASTSCASCMDD